MKLLAYCLSLLLLFCAPLGASTEPELGIQEQVEETLGISADDPRLPGVTLAEGVSQLTGVAVSPLLGVSAIGAWTYWTTDAEVRDQLPWLCRPWFWGTGIGVLALLFLAQWIPEPFKTPVKFLETMEDKFSAIIAGSTFVPFIVHQYSLSAGMKEEATVEMPMAMLGTQFASEVSVHWFLLPLAFLAFGIIWIVSHAFTILIALCPFPFIDSILKIARVGFLASLGVLYAISPVLAAIVSLLVLIICAFIAPWAFRVTVFGSAIGWDFLKSLIFKHQFEGSHARAFLARSFPGGFKTRCYGKLTYCPESEGLIFSRRWMFIGPEKKLNLDKDAEFLVEKGLISPSLVSRAPGDARHQTLVHFMPRYRHCSEELADHFRIGWRDQPLVRGIRGARQWFANQFNRKKITF
ncbi:hypothetical protein [Sulfuriroseicoccus oceanibius]|uniref:Uncharacterized protein n=1 Tax=Sulfuriroseicoccus oceanibius TaxID=2707525 RepID=A0A6B3L961_9BACT|nr:hypothetical protein [Sulfuriroseicoccus oceanibius]QQL45364.1 hypothetical protein G3M56_001880 [Sulfuriroseicoccus oceanibius]